MENVRKRDARGRFAPAGSGIDVAKLDARYEQLRTERSGWEPAWRDLAELFAPQRYRADSDTDAHKKPEINGALIDTVGVLGLRTLAAGLHGGMTSPVRPWFKLRLAHPDEGGTSAGVNAWLDEVTERMRLMLHASNFYNAVHGLFMDLGAFGTALMIETADEEGLHFERVPCGTYVLDVNGKGSVDSFFRRVYLTGRQIADLWPDTAPENISRPGSEGTRYEVIHGVYPRKDVAWGKKVGAKSKPFSSVYWIRGQGSGKAAVLSEGGYDMFPAFAPRWDVTVTDVYGRSPAMDVLPDCRMAQAMKETLRRTQHKAADPPMFGDLTVKRFGIDLSPGGRTFGDMTATGGRPLLVPIQQPDSGAMQHGQMALQETEKTVEAGLYVDLFRMLLDDTRKQITATEIQARQAEKLLLIGPVVERLHTELLSPIIARTYNLMAEWNALPEPPRGMGSTALDVEFESVLAQAQKIAGTSSIEQALSFIANLSAVQPEAIDTLDVTATAHAYLDRIGVPQACIADEDAVKAKRQQRAEAMQRQAAAEQMAQAGQAAQDFTGAARNLGQTPAGAGGETLMQTLLGGMGGG